jgi:outer membrane murein-binding lipoprotein Lpp
MVAGSIFIAGCSSGPSEAELKQLADLKAEVESLKGESVKLSQEKMALEKQLAEKNAALKKCNEDQQVVKQRLGK